jgi:electron transfer DM13
MLRFNIKPSFAVVAALAALTALGSLPAAAQDSGNQPKSLASGPFKPLAKKTSGMATIYELADGAKILRLTDLSTDNGPDLRVYLVAGSNGGDDKVIKDQKAFIDLGKLKGNKGNQNYDLPGNADLSKYHAVSIWCRRFKVNFGAASLADVNGDAQ